MSPDDPHDNERFCSIYRRLYPDVLAYMTRRLGPEEAVDAAADVFVVVWRRIESVPEGSAARPWIFGVARNVISNRRRASARFWRFLARYREQREPESENPEVLVMRRAENDGLLEGLERLRPSDRELLRLVAWEELSYTEIALVLGCSRQAVEQRVHRALRHLAAVVRTDTSLVPGIGEPGRCGQEWTS